MSGIRSRDLPTPGGRRVGPRRVSWPLGPQIQDWVVLDTRPHLVWTHWCPGVCEPGSTSRGRSAPCYSEGCGRCQHPKQFPPQEVFAFSALDPQGRSTVCLCPGHIADDVAAHPSWGGQWRGTVLSLSRLHVARSAGVYLGGVAVVEPDGLPMGVDVVGELALMWARFLGAEGGLERLRWTLRPERQPGEEG